MIIGQITIFAGGYAPRGWKECNGELLSTWSYMGLYSVLGNKYGGNGMDTFALPKIAPLLDSDGRGESKYIICVEGSYPSPP